MVKRNFLKLGMPTHYQLPQTPTEHKYNYVHSACGVPSPRFSNPDPHETDCINCRRTKVWKEAVRQNPEAK